MCSITAERQAGSCCGCGEPEDVCLRLRYALAIEVDLRIQRFYVLLHLQNFSGILGPLSFQTLQLIEHGLHLLHLVLSLLQLSLQALVRLPEPRSSRQLAVDLQSSSRYIHILLLLSPQLLHLLSGALGLVGLSLQELPLNFVLALQLHALLRDFPQSRYPALSPQSMLLLVILQPTGNNLLLTFQSHDLIVHPENLLLLLVFQAYEPLSLYLSSLQAQ
mmetsp:Transcript_132118/g.254304  ORF Transcript_132118/g.254304 Transcript_132118/m.254304 type:complete len:219 (-) Transcript_132118:1209-1865(-)